MKKAGLWVVAAASLFGATSAAWAQGKPCMADTQRLCADVQPGGGAIMQCLKSHREELSPACKKQVMQMKMQQQENKQQLPQQEQPGQEPQQPPPSTP